MSNDATSYTCFYKLPDNKLAIDKISNNKEVDSNFTSELKPIKEH